tara:strand:+ start:202 stop:570 length:369 start_codon:yes stop_codon:yes gene_type:complete
MSSFAVALPITRDSIDGFTMIKDFQTLVRQNLKMLILTAPGERVMNPDFGVGIRNYLFQNFGSQTYNLIETKINEQVSLFMPVVRIDQIFFDNQAMDRNILGLAIHYSIPDIGITEMLEFTI